MNVKTNGIVGWMNTTGNIWTLFSIIIVCILFFVNVNGLISANGVEIKKATEVHNSQLEVLRSIVSQLEINRRDHSDVKEMQKKTNELLAESIRLMDRMVIVVEQIEKRMQRTE